MSERGNKRSSERRKRGTFLKNKNGKKNNVFPLQGTFFTWSSFPSYLLILLELLYVYRTGREYLESTLLMSVTAVLLDTTVQHFVTTCAC